MAYPFVPSAADGGVARGPRLAMVWHMAEGGGTVSFLSKPNVRSVSVHFVIEYDGTIVQMLQLDHMHTSLNPRIIRGTNDAPYQTGGMTVVYGRAAAMAVMGRWADTDTSLGPNHASIAVEVEGFAKDGPTATQRIAIGRLAAYVGIPRHLGHRDFQSEKPCPGHHFPWQDIGHGSEAISVKLAPLTYEVALMVKPGKPVLDSPGGNVIYTTKPDQQFPKVMDWVQPGGSYYVIRMPGDIAGFLGHGNITGSVPIPPPVPPDQSVSYDVLVGGKPAGSVTLP